MAGSEHCYEPGSANDGGGTPDCMSLTQTECESSSGRCTWESSLLECSDMQTFVSAHCDNDGFVDEASCIANGGKYYKPRIVRKVTTEGGTLLVPDFPVLKVDLLKSGIKRTDIDLIVGHAWQAMHG